MRSTKTEKSISPLPANHPVVGRSRRCAESSPATFVRWEQFSAIVRIQYKEKLLRKKPFNGRYDNLQVRKRLIT